MNKIARILALGLASLLMTQGLFAKTPASASERLDGFDADVAQLAESYSSPGLAIAIVEDGEIVHTVYLGKRDIRSDAPIDERTQFGIGSVVKSFTSALAGSLDAEGAISLEKHPRSYLAQFPEIAGFDSEHLKISHLLTQTSGLPFMDGSLAFFPPGQREQIIPRMGSFKASCEPGDCWAYNNLNFTVLDALIKETTGRSKSELFKTRLFDPAGMTGSVVLTEAFARSPEAATGYVMTDGVPRPAALENFLGEHVYATAPDLARWMSLWMNEGRAGEVQVLPPEYVKRAISMQAIDNGAPPSPDDPGTYLFGYGHAWFVKSMDGQFVVHHGGNENGFSTHVLFIPAKGIGVVAITNQQNSILPNLVTDTAMRRMAGLEVPPIESYPIIVGNGQPLLEREQTALIEDEDDPIGSPVTELEGEYFAPGYGAVTVKMRGAALELETPLAVFTLIHDGGRAFRLGSTEPVPAGINLSFFKLTFGSETSPSALSLNIAAEPVVFEKR